MITLCLQSLANRRFVVFLTLLAIALSISLILSVERLRESARSSFANSASGIDLIVAPRGNDVQILMATVFGVGSTGTGLGPSVLEMVRARPEVAWAVPILQGDSHRGFPVIGTDASYFDLYKHSNGQALRLSSGSVFDSVQTAVVGADVAARFGYETGSEIVLAHGTGAVSFEVHDEAPFVISGILQRTNTAVDRMVFVSVTAYEDIHAAEPQAFLDPLADAANTPQPRGEAEDQSAAPSQINAIYVGLNSRIAVLSMQRAMATYADEPLSAVMPNVALLQLWSITGTAENALRVMSVAVVLAGMIGMVVMLSASLESRRREFAILRSVGAAPRTIVALIVFEALLVTAAGIVMGLGLFYGAARLAEPVLSAQFGFGLSGHVLNMRECLLLFTVLCFGALASLLPAWRVYRMTLADGLATRL